MRFTTITLAALAALFTTPILADWEIYTGTCSNFGETGYPYPNTLEPVTCDQCGECGRSGNYDGDPENGEPFTSTNPCCADEDCRGDYSLTYIPNNQYHNIYLGDEQIGYL
ncbi:hypothetical protein EG327_007764 [Venturia inaequalis]|uniref:Uncharacterized protein n=1 Tax=Venturia inaequalis TaxID=5025 RepID=A0A8H3UXC2_VENIN|nr:hypothetical protein EG327_007764 [Venturia inaequalis]